MENIELFDKYIKEELNESERQDVEKRLHEDKAFADEFRIYTTTVIGICKEAEQNDMDFGIALKNLSKDELKEIIGYKERKTKNKVIFLKPSIRYIASIAAMLVVVFSLYFTFQRNARMDVDNAIAMCYNEDIQLSRGGEEAIDIKGLTDEEIKERLPEFEQIYSKSVDDQTAADNGLALALTYIRLHQREDAANILHELINRFEHNNDFKGMVEKYEQILSMIE